MSHLCIDMKRLPKQMPRLVTESDVTTSPLHTITQSFTKGKKGRKQRKLDQREIASMFADENGGNRDEYVTEISSNVVKPYANMAHMSGQERKTFEHRFVQPKNLSQERYSALLKNKHKKIVVANGPAGTGKTLFATEYGIKYYLTNVYEKLIFTRPSVSVDEDLGYLPGTLEEKMAPWIRPIYDILYKFLTPKEVSQMMEDKLIEIAPLGYMRGRTFQNAWIVADEMQNSSIAQMKMLLTRLGENSRLIVTGDLEQHDKQSELNGLEDFLRRFDGKRSDSISSFEFEREDIQREPVVKEILDIYGGDNIPDYTSEEKDQPETDDISCNRSETTDNSSVGENNSEVSTSY